MRERLLQHQKWFSFFCDYCLVSLSSQELLNTFAEDQSYVVIDKLFEEKIGSLQVDNH